MTNNLFGVPQKSDFAADSEFSKLLAGRTEVHLVPLMLEFAADAYPNLDRVGCLVEVDRLAVACDCLQKVAIDQGDVLGRLAAVSRLMYEVEGFHGNREAYYEPQNSYLNEVLARRCGIPISLGILYMAVASRAGLQVFGTNTPGHFVVGCRCGGSELFVDPFTNGEILDREACKRRIEKIVGRPGAVGDEHLCPASALEIAVRVLRNLKAAYALDQRWPAIVPVQRRLTALLPDSPDERRDLGLIYLRAGQPRTALGMLEDYSQTCTGSQSDAMTASLKMARRMVAELN